MCQRRLRPDRARAGRIEQGTIGPVKLSRIAEALGCGIPDAAADMEISRMASLASCDENSVVFLADERLAGKAASCSAPVLIVKKGRAVPDKINLEVDDPYLGYARAASLFEDRTPPFGSGIHETALIDASARIDDAVCIGPGTIIGEAVTVGPRTSIGARCVIEKGSLIGPDCRIDSGAIIRYGSRIGARVIIQSGTVIGSDGFANAMDRGRFVRIPCFGNVIIEDDVEVGALAAIDRGNFEPTIIRQGVRLDNLVHIAHNVIVGEHSAAAAQTGVSGSTRIGRHVMIGGQAGFVGHITVGDQSFIGAQAGVTRSVRPGEKVTGSPARDVSRIRRIGAAEVELPALVREFKQIKKRIDSLESTIEKGDT
ncbi:MAG: UDP-3-O-(3-hydroxymyristoyl)glucosamine N-acyltransferase [Chitinivibrionales bacterium]|nr:UDP-3-O-(3-hydroxymyristoyl)glucosamine N-acyltransferase [Chitinivibrionales bacterium]MBD3395263.1 UDP-3-O-(3-hydroxymyristoyl)glucosamine N-acyltransferase [Chitinivibrionales bacterium]